MSVRSGLDRLQKEIDALTYNSRTVLNALIRSVMTAGSNDGYKVVRAEEEILLSRIDIYRLYKFYKDWEDNNFRPGDAGDDVAATSTQKQIKSFGTLVQEHDLTPVKDENGNVIDSKPTTNALVKHSKIMFQNDDNKDDDPNDPDTVAWLALIEDNTTPKLVSNSAPIPINLRTPVLDENLATTKYNQHPTYMFPMSYFTTDIFGYSKDGIDHTLHGNSWTIGADDYLSLESDNISLGKIEPSIKTTYGLRTGLYSLSFGYNTYAQGQYCIAGGQGSVIPDTDGDGNNTITNSLAIGYHNITSNDYSAALGGDSLSASGYYVGMIGGRNNSAVASHSTILGGFGNSVGGTVFNFRFPKNKIVDPTGCQKLILDANECIATATGNDVVSELNDNNIIIIDTDGDWTSEFSKGDTVRLFDFVYGNDSSEYHQTDGDSEKAEEKIISSVGTFEDTDDEQAATYTKITFETNIPKSGSINGGRISRIKTGNTYIGRYGAAVGGQGLIVEGEHQTAVGSYNTPNQTAKFLVGVGTGVGDANRGNVFEAHTNKVIAYGKISNDNTFPSTKTDPETGFVATKVSSTGLDVFVEENKFRVYNTTTHGFEYVGNVDAVNQFMIRADSTAGTEIINYTTPVTIQSGASDASFVGVDSTQTTRVDILASQDILLSTNRSFKIYANGGENNGDITLNWSGRLKFGQATTSTETLGSETYGALPTNKDQHSHIITSNIEETTTDDKYTEGMLINKGSMSLIRAGFHKLDIVNNPILGVATATNEEDVTENDLILGSDRNSGSFDYHLLNMGYEESAGGTQYNWQLLFGVDPLNDAGTAINDARIGVRRSKVSNANDNFFTDHSLNGNNMKHLAWYEDIQYTDVDENKVAFGEWTTLDNDSLASINVGIQDSNQIINFPPSGISTNITWENDILSSDNITVLLRYTKIQKTLFFEFRINIITLTGIDEFADREGRAVGLQFQLNPNIAAIFKPALTSSSAFNCSKYYRDVYAENADDATETLYHKIYTLHAAKYNNPAPPNESVYFTLRKSTNYRDDGSDVDKYTSFFFRGDEVNGTTIEISGFYETAN